MTDCPLVAAYGRAVYKVVAFPVRCVDQGPVKSLISWALGIGEECWHGCRGERLAGDLVLPKPGEDTRPFARGRVRNSTTIKEQLTDPCQRPLLPS